MAVNPELVAKVYGRPGEISDARLRSVRVPDNYSFLIEAALTAEGLSLEDRLKEVKRIKGVVDFKAAREPDIERMMRLERVQIQAGQAVAYLKGEEI
jgi:hypothetical protein